MDKIGLYVHVPFCAKKCPYCDFYSQDYRKADADRYVNAVILRMRQFAAHGCEADTLYFGGGTPSLLSPGQIGRIVEEARARFSLCGEVSMEANPNTLNEARLIALRESCINRLSVGVQSFDEQELTALGRRHSAEQAKEAIRAAKRAGFDDISLDLMLGVPYQTEESLQRTLETAVSLPVTHISAYMLKVEEATPYNGSPLLAHCPDEEKLAQMYLQTVQTLAQHGFLQYEISNFAKEGYQSRHNLKYWKEEPYFGIGAAAHSCFAGKRFASVPSLESFCTAAENGVFSDIELLEADAQTDEERLMLGLRLAEGVLREEMMNAVLPRKRRQAEMFLRRLCESGLAADDGEKVRLTAEGFLVSNEILAELLLFCEE